MIAPSSSAARGIAYMIVSCLCFALVWALIRVTSDYATAMMIVFFRTLIGALIYMANYFRDGWSFLHTDRFHIHAIRGATAITATFGIFYAVTVVPLSLVVAISYAAPLFTGLGAVIFFGERIKARRITALVVGFLAMLLVLRPGMVGWGIGVAAAMIGTLGIAASMLTIKALSSTDEPRTIVAYAFLLPLPVTLIAAIPGWSWPDSSGWLLLLAVGVTASVGQYCLTKSFALAEASMVLPFDFVRLVVATGIGAIFFLEPVDPMTLLGALIILGSSVYLAHREAIASRCAQVTVQ